MPISSNRRQRVIEFATPKVADLVVVERVDRSKNVNAALTAEDTAYGTLHPDTNKFPDFKLSLIKNDEEDDQGQFQLWYYVKDRALQDDYNWEFQAAGSENPRYDTVVRTYVIPRAFNSAGIKGIDYFDTNTPYIGFNTTTDAESLLTLGQRKDSNTFMPSGNTSVTPFNGEYLTGTGDPAPTGKVLFDTDYIFFERKQVRSGDEFLDTLFVVEQRVYVKKVPIRRMDVDNEFPYNDPSTTAFDDDDETTSGFGGLPSKETLYHKNETVYATISFFDTDNDEGIQDTVVEAGEDLGGAFRHSAHYIFSDPNTIYGVTNPNDVADQDGYAGGVHGTEYNFWGVDAYGIMREGRQLSDSWYAIVERQVIKTSSLNHQVAKYITYQNHSWPAVLTTGTDAHGDVETTGGIYGYTWTRKNGGGDTVLFAVYSRQAYSGPTKVETTIFWRKSKFSAVSGGEDGADGGNDNLTNILPMLPLPISFVSPLETLNVPPTLHGEITLSITTGTGHPVWELAGASFNYGATNYEDWPASIIISDTQKPYRGGWLRERVKAFAPNSGEAPKGADGGVDTT